MRAESFDPIPSDTAIRSVEVSVSSGLPELPCAYGLAVTSAGPLPPELGITREELARWGFEGAVGQTLVLPRPDGQSVVAVGVGIREVVTAEVLRDAAACFARAAARDSLLATNLVQANAVGPELAAEAVVEGILLGRYSYDALRSRPDTIPVGEVVLIGTEDGADEEALIAGALRGQIFARAGAVSRDLASTPAGYLTAPDMAEVAMHLADLAGLKVQSFGKDALQEMRCGGLLGVNAGSVVEPRMIQISYQPAGESRGHLGLVGKGITYDSGGISLKPSNAMHAAMKMDMSGAGAVLAAMSVLRDLNVPIAVTAFLACTDNMPSATATKLGDVLITRSGRTIEVVNTDAEGRLVLSDALTLAVEADVDAIVDIATLTGACLMALGPLSAGVMGNDESLLNLVETAAARTDEQVWRLPLDRRYRADLESDIADIKNLGGEFAGTVVAALFLEEWVDGIPWAHIDIAGPMQSDRNQGWRTRGATGFGARLLAQVACDFTAA